MIDLVKLNLTDSGNLKNKMHLKFNVMKFNEM